MTCGACGDGTVELSPLQLPARVEPVGPKKQAPRFLKNTHHLAKMGLLIWAVSTCTEKQGGGVAHPG